MRGQTMLGAATAFFVAACGMAVMAASLPPVPTRNLLLVLPLVFALWMCAAGMCAFRAAVSDPIPRAIGVGFIVAAMLSLIALLVVYGRMLTG